MPTSLCTRTKEVGKTATVIEEPCYLVLLESLIPLASPEIASHCRQGPAVESTWFPCIALNHWRRQLQEKCIEQQFPLYVAFIDFTKAFDLVSSCGLFANIRRCGCPDTLLNIILKLHDDMHAAVQVNGSRSRRFLMKRGVKQGCVLAPTLFAIFFTALLTRAFSKPSVVHLGNCLIVPVFVPSGKSDDYSSENCCM